MKKIKTKFRTIALLFSALVLFQGCMVYKSKPVSLEEASQERIKAKISSSDRKSLRFKWIGVEKGEYYGIRKIKGEHVRVPINDEIYNEVYVKDRTLSTIGTIITPIALLVGITYVIFSYDGGPSYLDIDWTL